MTNQELIDAVIAQLQATGQDISQRGTISTLGNVSKLVGVSAQGTGLYPVDKALFLNSSNIVQTTGQSTGSLMSQKAVSDELTQKANASTTYTKTEVDNLVDRKANTSALATKADKNGNSAEPFEANMLSLWESNFGYIDLWGGVASSSNIPRLRIESTDNGNYGIDLDLPLASKNAKVATSEDVNGVNSRVNALETSIPTAVWVQVLTGLGATYDESTGLFGLNGLTDLTLSEMKTIYRCTHDYRPCYDMASMLSPKYTATGSVIKFRTNFCNSRMLYRNADDAVNMNYFANGNSLLEVCVLYRDNLASARLRSRLLQNAFNGCTALREIVGEISLALITNRGLLSNAFSGCAALEEVRLLYLAAPAGGSYASISFTDSPALSMESIAYMINNVDTVAGIVIQLHNTAYNNAKQSAAVANALAAKTNVTLINADWTYKWCDNTEYHNTGSEVWERNATCSVNSLDGSVVWNQIGPINSGGEQQSGQIG